MNSISLPNVNITLNSAPTPSVGERRVLICGQLGITLPSTAATATTLEPVQNVHLLTADMIGTLFGANSMLAATVLRFLEASGRQCPLDVMGVTKGTGTKAAVLTMTTSKATTSGTIRINIISKTDYSVSIPVAIGDDQADVAAAIGVAMTALTAGKDCPFSSVTADLVTTITAADSGTIGANYSISVENMPEGLAYTCTAFAGTPCVAPTLTGLFDNVKASSVRYTGILYPRDWVDTAATDTNLELVTSLLDDRWNVSNAIMDGAAVVGLNAASATLITKMNALNTHSVVFVGNGASDIASARGSAITYYEDLLAAETLAYRDTRLTTGANIADIVSTTAPLDQVGGMSLASLPYFNTPLRFVPQPSNPAALFTDTEMTALETAGYTVIGKNTRNTGMVQGSTVTTYKTNINGTSDTTFKYLNYVDTASVVREFIFNNLKADFAQVRLTNGPLRAGRAFTNAQLIRAAVKRYFELLSSSDIYGALVQGGSDAQAFIDKYLVVTTNLTTRSALISAQVPIVTQLGTITFPITITTTLA